MSADADFRLRADRKPERELRRVLKAQLFEVQAAVTLPKDRRVEAVHSARKALKRIRAVLRLLALCRDDTPLLEEERLWYRDTGRLLQHLRDADVLPHTLARLLDQSPDVVSARVAEKLTHAFRAEHDAREAAKILRRVRRRVDGGRERLQRRRVLPIDRDRLCGAPRTTFFRAALAMELAVTSGHDEAYHTWRKRAKELWYQAQLLSEVCPSRVPDLVERLNRLQTGLGDAQDYTILLEALESLEPGVIGQAPRRRLVQQTIQARRQLWRDCEAQGSELFPLTPFGRA